MSFELKSVAGKKILYVMRSTRNTDRACAPASHP